MDDWLTPKDAGRLLGMDPSSVAGWARSGRLAGSERRDGRWRVRRSEVERVLAEREAARERRAGKWQPMTERERTPRADRPRCEAMTEERTQCRRSSAGPDEVGGRTVELCGHHRRQAEEWEIPLVSTDAADRPRAHQASRGRWTAEEDAYLRANPEAPAGVVAARLGRTVGAVRYRRSHPNPQDGSVTG